MDQRGVAMITTVGFAGPDVRSDVKVTVGDAPEPNLTINSSVASMYGKSIRQQVELILQEFGNPNVEVTLDDSGALPFVLDARMEAALCRHLSLPLPALEFRESSARRYRPRRTRLYIPGNSPKFMPNAGIHGADGIILDLEDSVPPEEKFAALALVRRALLTIDFGGAESIVRINNLDDIASLAPAEPDAFLIPKVDSAEQLWEISEFLDENDCSSALIAIIESALGVERAFEIAASTPRLVAMTLGVEDYLADIHATARHATNWANGRIMNAARAAGISPLASVTSVIDNDAYIREYSGQMKELGFEGIGCIHPRQIAHVHRAFAPTSEELEFAQKVITQFEAALKEGMGAIAVNGKMVDAPVYRQAQRTLESAERT